MREAKLVVVGFGAALSNAVAIARGKGDRPVTVVEVRPQEIATFTPSDLDANSQQDEAFAAIGPSALNFARYDLWAKLRLSGFRFATLIHPAAHVDATARVGEGALIGAGALLDSEVEVGQGTLVGAGTVLCTAAQVGKWCWLSSGVTIGAVAKVGAHTVLGVGTRVSDGAELMGYSEFDAAGLLRGQYPEGTFITAEFAAPGARMVGGGGV